MGNSWTLLLECFNWRMQAAGFILAGFKLNCPSAFAASGNEVEPLGRERSLVR